MKNALKTPKMVYSNTPRPWYRDGRKMWDVAEGAFMWAMIFIAVNLLGFALYMMVYTAITGK